jgi:hypothetical protein
VEHNPLNASFTLTSTTFEDLGATFQPLIPTFVGSPLNPRESFRWKSNVVVDLASACFVIEMSAALEAEYAGMHALPSLPATELCELSSYVAHRRETWFPQDIVGRAVDERDFRDRGP